MDRIKEFSRHTGLTYDDLKGGVVIAETADNEQAVIKDISVRNEYGRHLDFSVSGMSVGAIGSSGLLHGSELLDSNSQLLIKAAEVPFENVVYYTGFGQYENAVIYRHEYPTYYSGSSKMDVSSEIVQIASGLYQTYFMMTAHQGGVYFGQRNIGNATDRQISYIAPGSSQPTVVQSDFSPYCHDGRYIYALTTNSIRVFDTQSNTVVRTQTLSSTVTLYGDSSPPCAIDGWVFFVSTIAGSHITFTMIDSHTGNVHLGSVVGTLNDTPSHRIAATKDRFGNYLLALFSSSNGTRVYSLGKNLHGKIWLMRSVLNSFFSKPDIGGATAFDAQPCTTISGHVFVVEGQSVSIVDVENLLIVRKLTIPPEFVGSAYRPIATFGMNSVRAAEEFGTVDVRVTGIQTSL